MKRFPFFLLLAFSLYFVSCKPLEKIPTYLEQVNDSTGRGTVKQTALLIQKNDLLSIQIASLSTKPEVSDAIFNQQVSGGTVPGYLVDGNGNIEHHRLGIIPAAGLTKEQLAAEIKKRLTEPAELMKDPSVIIRFMNMKVTVLGEVEQQGPVNVPGEKLTILEAVGLAGGITEYGKKTTIKVLRETNGQREMAVVDLTSKDIFDSPFYNLVQNDVIIVESSNRKQKEAEQARTFQKVSFGISLVAVTATLANILSRN
ncbi:MAG: polysaccharide biosynthesis/export family protein [Chitinophagaceae bacterium]|nr:polysaccharide biosynthesis/export family protein [Chitinophagaceae bacterium]